ncbi:hypothetical protein [Paracoccus sp. PAMC 22219]|uniref:hypothetical protein n=1 Tax=Paracoccus sp. PAMC 22219 TaxID=1569209 RepID=UPI000A4CDADD|nr:hypothetical protein [Paracoccus sp. PAMC 22219]
MIRAGACAVALALSAVPASAQAVNDYPTNARVEYAFACMATNGQTRDMLDRCSCAIDRIAEVLPYADYVARKPSCGCARPQESGPACSAAWPQ